MNTNYSLSNMREQEKVIASKISIYIKKQKWANSKSKKHIESPKLFKCCYDLRKKRGTFLDPKMSSSSSSRSSKLLLLPERKKQMKVRIFPLKTPSGQPKSLRFLWGICRLGRGICRLGSDGEDAAEGGMRATAV